MIPSAIFLMLITPDDYEIAAYSINGFCKALRLHPELALLLYCNGLSDEMEEDLRRHADGRPQLRIKSNRAQFAKAEREIVIGEAYCDAAGRRHIREGRYESYGEVWSRELLQMASPLVGIVDADFEILDPSFLRRMLDEFAQDPVLAFYSAEFHDRRYGWDTFLRKSGFIQPRYHTCFCLYRRSALEHCSDFTYVEEIADGQTYIYDSGAKLQQILIERHGYRGQQLAAADRRRYLHYGAFSKNRSLRGRGLKLYRLIRIGRRNGWVHMHRIYPVAIVLRLVCYALSRAAFSRLEREREKYSWQH